MQDRFRFRVWNIKNKEMIYNAEIAYDGTNYNTKWQIGNNTNDGHVDCFGYYLDYEHEDYEIMQCTGMKDKNGKLIYEGDIIQIPDDYDTYGMFAGEKREIYFNEGGFRLKPKWNKNSRGNWLEDTKDFEVIGNIYENPELLEN